MSDHVIIDSIESLCEYIMNTKPNLNHLNEVIWHLGIRAIILEEADSETYCKQIREYWKNWKHTKERPIFIGVNL